LFFTMSHCFVCYHALHRSECCPQHSLGMLCCKCLDDPHCTPFLRIGFLVCLANGYVQGGMHIVLVW
jgi:hypothetical protein